MTAVFTARTELALSALARSKAGPMRHYFARIRMFLNFTMPPPY